MRRWPILVGIAAVLVVGIVLLLGYTSQPSFCSSCHVIAPFEDSWDDFEPRRQGRHLHRLSLRTRRGGLHQGQDLLDPEARAAGPSGRPTGSRRRSRPSWAGACRPLPSQPHVDLHPAHVPHRGANLECTECHSAVVHSARAVGEDRPQADADPAFCNTCHTGDIAPDPVRADIPAAGREHPGAPKIDVERVAEHPLARWRTDRPSSTGCPTTRSSRDTCLVCHQDPDPGPGLQGCHFARVPEFRIATSAGSMPAGCPWPSGPWCSSCCC